MLILRFQQERQHTGLPVVAMDDIRAEIHLEDRFHHGTGKERVLFTLGFPALINRAAEVVFIIYQVIGNIIINQFFHAHILRAPAKLYCKIG